MVSSLENTATITCYFATGDFETSTRVSNLKEECTALYDYKILMGFLPYWFRFAQCLHKYNETRLKAHLINAGKYFSDLCVPFAALWLISPKEAEGSLLVDEVNLAFWCYLTIKTISATYSYAWDIYMDWGLLRQNTPGHPHRFLRDKINYHPYFYYWAIFSDGVLRYWWIVPLFPVAAGPQQSLFHQLQVLAGISIFAEAFRRAQWALLRVENE